MLLLESVFSIRIYNDVDEHMLKHLLLQFVGKDFYKYFPFSRSNQNKMYLFFQRFFDVLISLVGIAIGLILVPFISIGNFLANRGPLLYIQERIGKNGNIFKMIKFRTMVRDA